MKLFVDDLHLKKEFNLMKAKVFFGAENNFHCWGENLLNQNSFAEQFKKRQKKRFMK